MTQAESPKTAETIKAELDKLVRELARTKRLISGVEAERDSQALIEKWWDQKHAVLDYLKENRLPVHPGGALEKLLGHDPQ